MSLSESLSRIKRIPSRIRQDLQIVRLAKNWPDLLSAKVRGTAISKIALRNGVNLASPDQVDLSFLFHEIWIDKLYTPKGYEAARGDIIIDIGGNIGVFAAYAAVQNSNVKVFSFEPFPANAEYFARNIKESKLSNVELTDKAIAGHGGTRTLLVSDSWLTHSLAEADVVPDSVQVECIALNDVLDKVGYCNLLKIDCEGSEYEIFENASAQTLRRIEKVVCEFHDGDHGNGRSLRSFFEAKDFRIDAFDRLDDRTGLICAFNLNFERA
jgi:FkbM family methyltransferase